MNPKTNITELYTLLENASLITVIGETGSGKSNLIFSYFDYLTSKYSTNDLSIAAYDVVRADYWDKEPIMPWVTVAPWEKLYQTALSNHLELVKGRQSGELPTKQRIIIHINECDLFMNDVREQAIELCTLIATYGTAINMQLLYETSRPGGAALPSELITQSDVKIVCPVPKPEYAQNFIVTTNNLPQVRGQILVRSNSLSTIQAFELPERQTTIDNIGL